MMYDVSRTRIFSILMYCNNVPIVINPSFTLISKILEIILEHVNPKFLFIKYFSAPRLGNTM